jgi:hypothetical protein
MGKWATYQKRGGQIMFGLLPPPNAAPTGFTAVTGGVGVITVTRVDAIPAPATNMFFQAIDNTTQVPANTWNATLTGLVSGRAYRVRASWFGPSGQISDGSATITVNAG